MPSPIYGGGSSSGEPALGNPAADGYLVASTAAGVRSWKDPSTLVISSLADSTDTTKKDSFDLTNIATGTTRTTTVPNANNVLVVPDTGASNNFLTGITALGAITKAQPAIANLSDATTAGQNLVKVTNPGAISFPKFAADNTVSTRTPAQVLSDIGAQASGSYAASGANADITSISALTGAVTDTQTALGTTTSDGYILQNTTASTSGTKDQYSPALRMTARVFSSTDHQNDWRFYIKTVSGGGNYSQYNIDYQTDSGGYSNKYSFDYTGALTIGSTFVSGNSITFPGDNGLIASGRSRLQSFSDGAWRTSNNASNGAATIVGLGRLVTAKTSNYPVVVLDSRTFFTNAGAGGEVDFTLPAAAANLTYTFYVAAAQTLKVIAGASTTIQVAGSVSASAGNITNATIGGCITLVAISSTAWVAESLVGTWTVT